MRRLVIWGLMLGVIAQFGVCASSPAAAQAAPVASPASQSQSKPRGARLYFLREKGLIGTEAGIKINGKQIGSVSKGFYFSVERPPGQYRIACVNPISMDYEVEIKIESGHSYYFGIGTPQTGPPLQNALNQAVGGSSGKQMRPTSLLMGGFSGAALYQIDETEGPAVIKKLSKK